MSRTDHHGQERRPRPRYVPTAKHASRLQAAMERLELDLDTTESTKSRRTR